MSEPISNEQDLRRIAAKRVKKRRGFYNYLGVWAAVSIILTIVWALSGGGYFWPAWAIFGMGIAAIFQAIDLFLSKPVTESDVDAEVAKLRKLS